MKTILKTSLFTIIALSSLVISCKKEKPIHADLSALDRAVIINTPLDNWLDANYLTPYNIMVKYRWDAFEDDLSKDLVPPKEALVQPTMESVRDIWIKPFETVGGADFMKINSPKQFYLVGSPSYNEDGTITLGTAEGGKKITLFIINGFDRSKAANTQEMMHVIHHEFTHILNQKIAYDPAFKAVTQNGYTGNWNLITTATARTLGFITNYAQASPIEDFAEMTSIMLTTGKYKYDILVNAIAAAPRALLRAKEAYVVAYFKAAWSIDFYALQTQVATALDKNLPALPSVVGPGKTYTTFANAPATVNALAPQSTEFLALWNTSKATLTTLTQYQFIFGANNAVTLRFTYGTANADLDLTVATDASGLTKFTANATQGTGTNYTNYNTNKVALSGVVNYVLNNQFRFTYATTAPPGTAGFAGAIGAFYKSTDATSYMIGTLN